MSGPLVRPHIGWQGQFTTQRAEGAWPNDTRVRKVRQEPTDTQRIGSVGRILGSLSHPAVGTGYFIEWDHWPQTAVFIMGSKIRPLPADEKRQTHVWGGDTPL